MRRLFSMLMIAAFLVGAVGAWSAADEPTAVVDLRLIGEETGMVASAQPLSPDCVFDEGYGVYLCPEPHTQGGSRDPQAAARAKALLNETGLLLVPDSTDDKVMAFDPTTGDLVDANFIPADPDHLSTPIHAMLSAGNDTILVSDQVGDVVREYDLDGNYLGLFAPAGGADPNILDNIRGMALRPNGNLLVTVGSGANADAVAEFDTGGNYLGLFVDIASGGLGSPFDVYGRSADWLVGGINSDAIHRYDLDGNSIGNLTPIDTFPEQIYETGTSNVLVADFSGAEEGVVEYTSDGTLLGIYSPPEIGGFRGVYDLPNGNILTTTGAGVFEIDRAGNLVETKIDGVSARYIQYIPPQGAENTLTCGFIIHNFVQDPYGRPVIKWRVQALDQDLVPVGLVAVDADLSWPTGGPVSRTRLTNYAGLARFPWGANAYGTWTIDVTNMTLEGYTFVDGENCSATAMNN